MTDFRSVPPSQTRGCLAAVTGIIVLVLLAPFVFVIRWWRRWRRGRETGFSVEVRPEEFAGSRGRSRLELTLDLPAPVDREVHRRVTARVVRVADGLSRPGDSYCAVYRLVDDPEPYLIPLGPQLQRLGDRFALTLAQGALAARNVVWLALGPGTPPVEVIDPVACDPEQPAELERLLLHDRARWTMASSWANVGPSWILRLVVVAPTPAVESAARLLGDLGRITAR